MRRELYINGKDAFGAWGIILADESLTNLMSPPPMKEYITNKSALDHGKQVLVDRRFTPKVDERDFQLVVHLRASDMTDFLTKYNSFIQELQSGWLEITTTHQPGVAYHCLYISCQQFSQFNGRLAKYVLKLNEPNPTNRIPND